MESIEAHIKKDKEILKDPTISEPQRHHIEDEIIVVEAFFGQVMLLWRIYMIS